MNHQYFGELDGGDYRDGWQDHTDGLPSLHLDTRIAHGPGYPGMTRRYSIDRTPSLADTAFAVLPAADQMEATGQPLVITNSPSGHFRARVELAPGG